MDKKKKLRTANGQDFPDSNRRSFLLAGVAGLATGALSLPTSGEAATSYSNKNLQVWSCGGLAEGIIPANEEYFALRGVKIAYTGAFAAALGKSLMGSGRTEVFCGRVLALSQNLKKSGRMIRFVPLCYTNYVIVTPKGNPKNIQDINDLTKQGMRIAIAPDASPPGGEAVMGILKKAGILNAVMANAIHPGTCVQTSVEAVADGNMDAMIVELRIPRFARFKDRLDVLELPFKFLPPGPLTFTAGIMEEAKDKELAQDYINWLTSSTGGGPHLERAGFIPADSERGRELTELLGVKDV